MGKATGIYFGSLFPRQHVRCFYICSLLNSQNYPDLGFKLHFIKTEKELVMKLSYYV